MHKKDIVQVVTEALDGKMTRQQVQLVFEKTLETIATALQMGERVTITGLGTFEARERKERMGTNPNTGEKINIAAHYTASFSTSTVLRRALNNGHDQKEESPLVAIIQQVLAAKGTEETETTEVVE